ncbi:MAG: LPS export ABC transporter periplasmic protein LptC [Rhodobacteraceae bacterium]|nr:LPS export ABC transporter periplasmic protein LptC [Paracoccaceae bacterium]
MLRILLCALIGLFAGAHLAVAQTFSDGFAGFGSNDGAPIEIEADELKVEDQSSKATFLGNVVVVQGESQLKTRKLVVYYDGSATGAGTSSGVGSGGQDISRLEAYGSVYISSKDQVATGDRANFDMKSEIMVMTGQTVTLTQGPNQVTGNKLTVNLKTGKADLEAQSSGRVKVRLKPNNLKTD